MIKYKLSEVTLDNENCFLAYILEGEDWNGFAIPYFKLAEGLILIKYLNSDSKKPKSKYDEIADVFLIQELSEEGYEEIKYFGEDVDINDEKVHLYPIGARSWIWSEKHTKTYT